jgi:DNA-binding CsgD family transcriptional regulator
VIPKSKIHPIIADVGVVLTDRSLKLLACDRGAAAILSYPNQADAVASSLPREIMDALRHRKPTDLASIRTHFHMGKNEYMCRAYLVESHNESLTEPLMALHLEKVSSTSDAIHEVGAKYHLTDRELEALRGISMGLTSKEVAERMNISPNTVKAFLRLIMIKMGVTTRGGIVANILNRSTVEERAGVEPAEFDEQAPAVGDVSRPNARAAAPPRVARRSTLKNGI